MSSAIGLVICLGRSIAVNEATSGSCPRGSVYVIVYAGTDQLTKAAIHTRDVENVRRGRVALGAIACDARV
jgi:hypothetical protein